MRLLVPVSTFFKSPPWRARVLMLAVVGLLTIAGCGNAERDDARPHSGESPSPAGVVEDLPKEPHDMPGQTAPQESAVRPNRLPEDITSARPLPGDDDPNLVPQPLSPSESRSLLQQPSPSGRMAFAPDRRSLSARAPRERFATIRVFYGTNRRPTGSHDPKEVFGTLRGDTSFGFCDVSIPHNHKVGQLESPSIWRFEFRENPEKHVVLLRVLQRSQDEFLNALRQKVWGSMELVETPQGPALQGGEVFVFVHGYNNTFEAAARRTAQIAHDLKFRGAPIMYSWPSQAKSSLDAYRIDGQMAGWSEDHLIDFVTTVAEESGARRVHLIAHSMGNRILSGALRRLVEQRVGGRIPRFNEVILSAPDVDADYFKTAIAPRIVHSADRITIYSSSRDYALKMSSFFNPQARRRLGEAGRELTVFPEYTNIDVVDATQVETDLFSLNHSYLADSPTILTDMGLLLQGYTTEQRGLASVLNRLAWQIRNVGQQISEGVSPPQR